MSTAPNPNGHTSPWDAGTSAMLTALMQSQMAQNEAMLRLIEEQSTRSQAQAAQKNMLFKTLVQVQATQNEMLWKALLEQSAPRGPSVLEILRELKSMLPDRTNDILAGIEIGKSLMAHWAPAAPRDDLGALLRGVVEAIGQDPGRKPPQPRPAQRSAFSEAELRVAVSDPAKWQHIRTLLAMKFSERPRATSLEEVQFRAFLADPIAWERFRVKIVASHAPQQPAAVPQPASSTMPQPVIPAGIVPPEPTPAEIRAAISDPVKWAQIRTVFAIRFSQQPPTTPKEATICAMAADPVIWESVRTVIAADHAPQQPAVVSQAATSTPPQSATTTATDAPPEPALVRQPGTVAHAPQQRAAGPQPARNATPQSVEIAGAAPPAANRSPQPAEASIALSQRPALQAEPLIAAAPMPAPKTPAPNATQSHGADAAARTPLPPPNPLPPSGNVAEWQALRTVCAEGIRAALTKHYAPAETATSGTTSADTAKPNAQPTHSPPSRGEPALTHRRLQRRNPVRNPVAQRLTVRAPPQTNADHNLSGRPILCLLTAERREPVLFGGRRLPIGLG
jgi:hypothetical protein